MAGFTVRLDGIHFEPFYLTFKLASGITNSHVGYAVSIDTSAANTVKLAAAADTIIGRLATVESRTVEGQLVGTVAIKFSDTLPIDTVNATGSSAVIVGSTVVGSGGGKVKARTVTGTATPDHAQNYVVELLTQRSVDYAVVVKV